MTDYFREDIFDPSSPTEDLLQHHLTVSDDEAFVGSATTPETLREQAERQRQQWQHWALENIARKDELSVKSRGLEEFFGVEQRIVLARKLHAWKLLISQHKQLSLGETSQAPLARGSSTTSSALIAMVRDGLQSALYGSRLGSEYLDEKKDSNNLTDDEIKEFIRVKLGLIFAALAQRYRFQNVFNVQVGDKKSFLSDVGFLINTRMPVAAQAEGNFVDLLYKEISSNPDAIPLSGDWGEARMREDGLHMIIKRPVDRERRRSTSTIKIR